LTHTTRLYFESEDPEKIASGNLYLLQIAHGVIFQGNSKSGASSSTESASARNGETTRIPPKTAKNYYMLTV
jgi:hypothetical protein